MPTKIFVSCLMTFLFVVFTASGHAGPEAWKTAWPDTDFARHAVELDEIFSGGVGKDQIPSIDDPVFAPVDAIDNLAPEEPVISLVIAGEAKAYPLRIMIWHEIVNDSLGGIAVAVTYCPLCNSAIVFDRRLDGLLLDFGTTGKLRHSDLVMYDRQTESWWQQFLGEAIVGELTGRRLKILPARLESWARFQSRFPAGEVLIPNAAGSRRYGSNPYVGYDSASEPFLYRGSYPENIAPMARVVAVGNDAWSLALLQEKGTLESGDLLLSWQAGQSSALDDQEIGLGRDVGNVAVQRRVGEALVDVPHEVTFAFVFHAFRPDGIIHQ